MRIRRKQKKLFGRMSSISIVMIIALSAMGVGYAAWSDRLSIAATIKTGFILPQVNSADIGYSGLDYTISHDNTTISITGEVYPGFNRDISVEVNDNGSIPTILNGIDELSTTEIVNFRGQSRNRYGYRSLLSQDTDKVETFNININASENDDNIMGLSSISYVHMETNDNEDEIAYIQNEIDKTKEEINNIQTEIDRLKNLREEHNFKYNLNFQQGL